MAVFISREAAFDALAPFCKTCRFSVNDKNCICCPHGHTRIKLNTIAAADVRPVVRGRWEIADSYAGPGLMNLKCSVCGEFGGTWRENTFPSLLYKFCPNCGADMSPKPETEN